MQLGRGDVLFSQIVQNLTEQRGFEFKPKPLGWFADNFISFGARQTLEQDWIPEGVLDPGLESP